LEKGEAEDAEYYRGKGAPRPSAPGERVFFWIKVFSDGCAAQFMCAAFLLFLSMFLINFGIRVVWNWFCSCHGKTGDCDAEGGTAKALADNHENEDSVLTERQTVRNAREFCLLGRSNTPTSQGYYRKKGAFTTKFPSRDQDQYGAALFTRPRPLFVRSEH